MKRRAARRVTRPAIWPVITLLAALPAFAAADHPLPVHLQNPARQADVFLGPGDRVLHVVFFATWCQPCLEEFPRLAELEERWKATGYRLVLIAVPTRQTAERLAGFVRDHRSPGEVLWDRTGEASVAFGVERIPAHFLLDVGGRVVDRASSLDALSDAVQRRVTGSAEPPGGGAR